MIKAKGYLNGSVQSSELDLLYFKAYWANLDGEKNRENIF